MTFKKLEVYVKKAMCRLDKKITTTNGVTLREVKLFAIRKDESIKNPDEADVLIMRISSEEEDATFDKMADKIHEVILKAGIKMTISALAESMEENSKMSGLVDQDGKPLG